MKIIELKKIEIEYLYNLVADKVRKDEVKNGSIARQEFVIGIFLLKKLKGE